MDCSPTIATTTNTSHELWVAACYQMTTSIHPFWNGTSSSNSNTISNNNNNMTFLPVMFPEAVAKLDPSPLTMHYDAQQLHHQQQQVAVGNVFDDDELDDDHSETCCACTLSSLGASSTDNNIINNNNNSNATDDDSLDGTSSISDSVISFLAESDDDDDDDDDQELDVVELASSFMGQQQLLRKNHPFPLECTTIVSSTCSSPIHSPPPNAWEYHQDIFEAMDDSDDDDDDDSLASLPCLPTPIVVMASPSTHPLPQPQSVNVQLPNLDSLPDDVTLSMLSFLDVASLKQMRVINRRFYDLAGRNDAGWRNHCELLWSRKAHVCSQAKTMLNQPHWNSAMDAYRLSCQDGLYRHEISKEELCFDPRTGQGTIWSFRFKNAAGPDWTSFDPWHVGLEARRMVFLADGSVKQFVPVEHSSQGNTRTTSTTTASSSPSSQFELRPPFFDALNHQQHQQQHDAVPVPHEPQHAALPRHDPSRLEVRWRFISQPMDLPSRPMGAYIRLTVSGRDVPTYIVHRSPTRDWSFVLENLWAVYTSAPLFRRASRANDQPSSSLQQRQQESHLQQPQQQQQPLYQPLHQQQQRRPTRMRLRRTSGGGRWLNVADLESDSDDDDDENDASWSSTTAAALEDSVLSVTNRWQWREALLYNYGAVNLPEGEGAEAEFDRVWNLHLRQGNVPQQPYPNPHPATTLTTLSSMS